MKIFTSLLLILIGLFAWLAIAVFPAISGYGAKNMCSALYLQHRAKEAIIREDLADFPKSLGSYTVDEKDSVVTGSVFGLARKKAIYRNGCGCTLVNDFSEADLRRQVFLLPAKPEKYRDSLAWPVGDKVTAAAAPNINKEQLERAVNSVLQETTASGQPALTRAVVVLYKGNIVAEKYADGFDKNTVMLGWSMAKSFIGTMVGILVNQHKLSIEEPAPVAAWANTEKQNITIKQLLQQTTGLDYTEIYTRPSSVTKMLFSKGDMAGYAAALPLKYAPGTAFNYSGGNTNILSRIIRDKTGDQYTAFPYTALFHKINAYSFLLEPDASGTYVGSSYCYATARDFARFGLLYYNNGNWNGEQLLPEQWVKDAMAPSGADKRKHYGYQFWLNGQAKEDPSARWYPDVPADMYFADGYGGQNIFIIPSEELVVVRLGVNEINANTFLKEVIAAVHH